MVSPRLRSVLKTVRNVVVSFIVLAIALVGAGAGYTWYAGQHSQDNTNAFQTPAPVRTVTTKQPVQRDPNARVGASVQTITSPVTPGSNSSIGVKTNPGAKCTISVVYDKTASKDSGLVPKTADEYGLVEWTWTVEPNVPLGTWPVKVVCANAKNSAMVQNDLKVVKTIE